MFHKLISRYSKDHICHCMGPGDHTQPHCMLGWAHVWHHGRCNRHTSHDLDTESSAYYSSDPRMQMIIHHLFDASVTLYGSELIDMCSGGHLLGLRLILESPLSSTSAKSKGTWIPTINDQLLSTEQVANVVNYAKETLSKVLEPPSNPTPAVEAPAPLTPEETAFLQSLTTIKEKALVPS